MDRVIVFIIGLPLGILIMVYRSNVREIIGTIDWAEKNLGSGGTHTMIILIGLAVSILSVMYAFGTLQSMFVGSIGSLF